MKMAILRIPSPKFKNYMPDKSDINTADGSHPGPNGKRRYAIVGLGSRSSMFSYALLGPYAANSELVGLCDVNATRMNYYNRIFHKRFGVEPVTAYLAEDFERMIREQKPDVVIVTSIDRSHHTYIIRAMNLGCDVITEKPMTVDAEKCRQILDAVQATGRKLRVAFNYRYSPARTKVKELLLKHTIGDVKSVHFEWLLDTVHGADYFRRWHRDKRNSGGLMVHKSTHHFDLVNWWLDSSAQTVFGFGNLAFYGKQNAESRGVKKFYTRGTSAAAKGDPFALNLKDGADLEGLYLDAEFEDGYQRDLSVFGDGISIEDTMNLVVRYQNGVQLSYSLTAYAGWEGYRVAFNGTKGRIEFDEMESSYVSAGNGRIGESRSYSQRITVFPHGDKPYVVELPPAVGGHGGGDTLLLENLLGENAGPDPYGRAATHLEGAQSILTGIAANRSFETGCPVVVADLLKL